jgi:chemosensory pili system protein ChpA (sensor histidine kinase/response regulator)
MPAVAEPVPETPVAQLPAAEAPTIAEPPVAEAPVTSEPSVLAPPSEEPALAPHVDPELLEIFCAEAEELLESMEHYLQVWRQDPTYADATGELKRSLHTLKGSARTAGALAIGNVTHRIETLFEEGRAPAALHAPLAAGIDELHLMVSELHRGRAAEAGPALAAIEAAAAAALAPPAAARPVVIEPELPPAAMPEIVLEAPASWDLEPVPQASHESLPELSLPPAAEPIVFTPA